MPATIEKRNYEWPLATTWDGFFTQDKVGGTTQRVPRDLILNTLNSSGWLVRSIESFRQSGFSDTVTIQAAASSGLSVWFPVGTWNVTSQVTFASNTIFVGSGEGSVIAFVGVKNAIMFNDVGFCALRSIKITGTMSAMTDYTSGIFNFQNKSHDIKLIDVHAYSYKMSIMNFNGSGGTESVRISTVGCLFEQPVVDYDLNGWGEKCFHIWMPSRALTQTKYSSPTVNGSRTAFDTTFPVATAAELSVYWQGKLISSPNYTLTGVGTGGNVTCTFTSAPTPNHALGSGSTNACGDIVRLTLNSGPMFQKIDVASHTAIRILDCTFVGGWQGILVDADDFEMRGCCMDTVDGPFGIAFGKDIRVINCEIMNFRYNALAMSSGGDSVVDGYQVEGCTLRSSRSTLHGINVYKQGGDPEPFGGPNIGWSRGGVIANNRVIGVAQNAVFLYGNGYATVTGNYLKAQNGISISTNDGGGGNVHPGHVQVTGNVCEVWNSGIGGGPSGAISVSDISVTGNTIFAQPGVYLLTGIYFANATNSIIKENIIRDVNVYVKEAAGTCTCSGGVSQPTITVSAVVSHAFTITLSTAPITGNVFVGTVNGVAYNVPFRVDGPTTFADIVAALRLNPATSASGNYGTLVISVTAAVYTGIGISLNYPINVVVEGNQVTSTRAAAGIWHQLASTSKLYIRNNFFSNGVIARFPGNTYSPKMSGNFGDSITMTDDTHTPTTVTAMTTAAGGNAACALKVDNLGSNVIGVIEVVFSAGITASSTPSNFSACVAHVDYVMSYTGNAVTIGAITYLKQANGATITVDAYVAGSYQIVFRGVSGIASASLGVISAQLLNTVAQAISANYV